MAGGLGTRMKSAVPKHFHPILGRRMVDWVIHTGLDAGADPLVVVASPATRDAFAERGVDVAVQEQPLGTGDAVRSAREALAGHDGDVLVLSGDTPLLTAQLLVVLVPAAIVILGTVAVVVISLIAVAALVVLFTERS